MNQSLARNPGTPLRIAVSLKVNNHCSAYTTSLDIYVDNQTGVRIPGAEAAKVALYPKPSRGTVVVESLEPDIRLESVKLVNIAGTVVAEEKVTGNRKQLQVGHLPPGIYSVYLLTNKGALVRKLELQY